jgi:hypothetical protein
MFDLADRRLVWIPVLWDILKPSETDGEVSVSHGVSIEIEVDIKDRDELVEIASEMLGLGSSAKDEDELKDLNTVEIAARGRELETQQFLKLVSNWRKFYLSGKPVEFTPENVKKLLAVPGFLAAFQTAYFKACSGKVETRKGN